MIAIQCTDLVKRYGQMTAVDKLNLEIYKKECFGLLGPNGAGKTTTAEMLEGLLKPDSGQITVLGDTWGGSGDRRLRERLGVALQQTELTDRLTVAETIGLFRSFYSRSKPVDEIIEILGLVEKRKTWVSRLSGGERQRLALACSLVGEPEVLFLDEPTTGLDPQARLWIWEVILAFKNNGGTVFLTTHYMEEAERLCDRVGIMDRGRLIALDTPEALIDSLNAAQIIELSTDKPLEQSKLEGLDGIERVVLEETGGYTIKVAHLETTLSDVLAEVDRQGATIVYLKTRRTTLEDVFVNLTGRALRDE
ncbi:MAG: ABC transporter ATP-binding protein [Myxococcota bacterium]|nr:ABC transporter ATP-binding protein [Myxococcota bacterium]